jgi:3-oxoacyl-[acyl-carrier-protein] synthase II
MNRKVVITGLGAVTPLGNTVPAFWDGLVNGRSGISRIASFDPSNVTSQIAGEVKDFDGTASFKVPKDARRNDLYAQFSVAAAKEAFEHAGLYDGAFDRSRGGCIIGSSIGGIITIGEQFEVMHRKGARKLSPFTIPMLLNNMASGNVAIELGLEGPSYSVGAACATANQSLGEAWRAIRTGEADLIVAGGTEAAICELAVGGFCAMKALSTRNDSPTQASRPFDRGRDGFVIAEGAGVLVLEEESHALRRGARILGELAGNGVTTDAHHMTHPIDDGRVAARAMTIALQHAGLNASDVDYINAHATSTPVGDICESQAIRSVFGERPVLVSATKSMTGHLCGATGAIELIACVKTIETGLVPPTINLEDPDPACALNHVANVAREARIDVALSNSFGFGGHNSALVVRRYQG